MSEIPTSYEKHLRDLERLFNVQIAVHDELGVLRGTKEESLLPGRNYHPHPYCYWLRKIRVHDAKCREYCVYDINACIRSHPETEYFERCCWKGVREIAIPIFYGGLHTLTIFVGAFRLAGDVCPLKEKKDVEKFNTLPLDDYDRLRNMVSFIRFFAVGMLHSIYEERDTVCTPENSRKTQILRFIHSNAHLPTVDLKALARALSLSESRTGHLVVEECGKTFHSLLMLERIQRCRVLLLTEDYSLDEIAYRTGFGSTSYLCRMFRLYNGISPAQFRHHPDKRLP